MTDWTASSSENVAVGKGAVVFQNDRCNCCSQPDHGTGAKRPLLIMPPWINKYYIWICAVELVHQGAVDQATRCL